MEDKELNIYEFYDYIKDDEDDAFELHLDAKNISYFNIVFGGRQHTSRRFVFNYWKYFTLKEGEYYKIDNKIDGFFVYVIDVDVLKEKIKLYIRTEKIMNIKYVLQRNK